MLRSLWAPLALTLLLACGGGGGSSSPPPPPPSMATSLVYTDPQFTGWRLVRNGTLSTPTHLVLDLMGPPGEAGYGVALTLQAESGKVRWTKPTPSDPQAVRNQLYSLGSGTLLIKAAVNGDQLVLGVFHKGASGSPTTYAGPLISVALDLGTGVASGTTLPIQFEVSKELRATGLATIHVAAGELKAQ